MALKFSQFVKFKQGLNEEARKKVKEEKFNQFMAETLKKYKAKTINELNDDDFESFLEEVKSHRKFNISKL